MIDGILLVDKPSGPTSHDVVDLIRRRYALPKVGHTGTLDPLATGLLVLTLGKATKLTQEIMAQTKDYEVTLLLGLTSTTQDIQGAIMKQAPYLHLSEEEVRKAILSFQGEQWQIPPMFCAAKKNGKRLYELARRGKEVVREPKRVTFFKIAIFHLELPRVTFFVSCSKGTYLRTLCHDVGEKLKCGGVLAALRRVRLGSYQIADATPLKQLLEMNVVQFSGRVIPLKPLATYAAPKEF